MSLDLDHELALVFLEEARGQLIALEDRARSTGARASVAHDLAASAGLVGLLALQSAATEAERALRAGEDEAATIARLRELVAALEKATGRGAQAVNSPVELLGTGGFDSDEARLLRTFFLEEAHEHIEGISAILHGLQTDPTRRDLIDELLRKTHTLKGSAATVGLTAVAEEAHRLEEVFADLRSGRLALKGDLLDALMSAADSLRSIVDAEGTRTPLLPLREHLEEELAAITALGTSPSETATRLDPAEDTSPRVVLAGKAPIGERLREDMQTMRVDAARIDLLMDCVGELVFDRTRIERKVQELRGAVAKLEGARSALRSLVGLWGRDADLAAVVADVEAALAEQVASLSRATAGLVEDAEALRRTTTSLQDGLTQVRMLPVRALFHRLARPLREMARRAGKRVELVVAGEDTELDKSMVEQISDPLIQILRNAVAHGIETAETRLARGKPHAGRISLLSYHRGESVYLEVADDGAGIDPTRLRRALVESGRMTEAKARVATDEQIVASIFEPGVSTRDAADELAGHGVGLDVVRENIARLGGEITVASTPSEGTRFVLRMPLTTAITQALLFQVGDQVYALPSVHVREATDVVPIVSLHRALGVDVPPETSPLPMVVLEFAGRQIGVTCDHIIGERKIVIKSLGQLLAPLSLYAGATISGVGKVQLILDPAALVHLALPTSPKEARADGPSTARASRSLGPRPTRILLADDSLAVRETVSRMLVADGHIVDQAPDGLYAWQMLQDVHYDLLVTDLEMPNLDGLGLIEKVRRSPLLGRLPVLVISSRASGMHRDQAVQVGADAFLHKPVSRHAIRDSVGELIARTEPIR